MFKILIYECYFDSQHTDFSVLEFFVFSVWFSCKLHFCILKLCMLFWGKIADGNSLCVYVTQIFVMCGLWDFSFDFKDFDFFSKVFFNLKFSTFMKFIRKKIVVLILICFTLSSSRSSRWDVSTKLFLNTRFSSN